MDSKLISVFLGCQMFLGCVGTDFINDPEMKIAPKIKIEQNSQVVVNSQKIGFSAIYIDENGDTTLSPMVEWSVLDSSIATIDAAGFATGKNLGQTFVSAFFNPLLSDTAVLTVVLDSNALAQVILTPVDTQAIPNDTIAFTALSYNLKGDSLPNKTYNWTSSDSSIAIVQANGLAFAIAPGIVDISATTEGLKSMPARLEVRGQSRTGTFTKRTGSSYTVSGTAVLKQQMDGSLELSFENNFRTSNGPALEVYLSTDNKVGPGSISLGPIKEISGGQSYNVPVFVGLSAYDWIIIHCVPFNVTFGYANLK